MPEHTDAQIQAEAARLAEKYPDAFVQAASPLQLRLSWAIMIVLVVVGAIQAAGPEALGIPPLAFRWLGVLAVVLSTIQGFLPPVKRWIQDNVRG